ncbi:MAG: Anthranilate synthase component II [Acetothermia bacterium 64_32]|nr:MAG: Anthranilate synthase component II [Acetothermia bacterium 64_32]HAF69743.1 aminodeoxychorismate/anthranilate synthase component II [Candidatus Acetothermia bacterium]
MRVLVIDNYDSFTYNLVQYLGELGAEPLVFRNDAISLEEAEALSPAAIVLSPGPGDPCDRRYFGVCADILRGLSPRIPTLGVCLGHQGIGAVFGGRVVHARALRHGKTSRIFHDGEGVFRGLPNGFLAARYHSLVLERASLPQDLLLTAESDDGEVMGVRHRRFPIEGIQFHPESVLTEHGKALLANFLKEAERWKR